MEATQSPIAPSPSPMTDAERADALHELARRRARGVPVSVSGLSLLGGRSDKRSSAPALPDVPTVKLRVFSLLGGVQITSAPGTAGGRSTRSTTAGAR